MKKLNRLPEAELTVMRAVWRLEPPVPTGAIRARLEKERPWNLSALQTLLARLTERGFLSVGKEGRQNVYTPLVDEGEYLAFENAPFLEGRGLPGLVAALYDSRSVSREELAELRVFLDEAMGKEGDGKRVVLEISLAMSVVLAVLLALRPLLKKRLRAGAFYWVWLLAALRLCIPFNLSLPQAPVTVEAVPRAVYRVDTVNSNPGNHHYAALTEEEAASEEVAAENRPVDGGSIQDVYTPLFTLEGP